MTRRRMLAVTARRAYTVTRKMSSMSWKMMYSMNWIRMFLITWNMIYSVTWGRMDTMTLGRMNIMTWDRMSTMTWRSMTWRRVYTSGLGICTCAEIWRMLYVLNGLEIEALCNHEDDIIHDLKEEVLHDPVMTHLVTETPVDGAASSPDS
jgi:hypothetical protein